MKKILLIILALCFSNLIFTQDKLPIRGLAIAVPNKENVDRFVKFINEELPPRKINTLVLRVDYNFQYQSHPKLTKENALSQDEVNKIVTACQKQGIDIVPQINLLGHQSWHSELEMLLKVYPEFDETPNIKLPEKYEWPNEDNLYCKSYCPLHPEVHNVVFALVDEIVTGGAIFEAVSYLRQTRRETCST